MEFEGRIKFVKVDVDAERELAMHYDIYTLPTLLFLVRGEVVRRSVGPLSRAAMRSLFQTLLEEAS